MIQSYLTARSMRDGRRTKILAGYILFLLATMSLVGPIFIGQAQESDSAVARKQQCEEVLKQPLTTLDLNGDGECDEIDVSLFKSLVGSCEKQRLSQIEKLERLDLNCDRCITRHDVETFRAHCEKAAGEGSLSKALPPEATRN